MSGYYEPEPFQMGLRCIAAADCIVIGLVVSVTSYAVVKRRMNKLCAIFSIANAFKNYRFSGRSCYRQRPLVCGAKSFPWKTIVCAIVAFESGGMLSGAAERPIAWRV